MQKRKHDNKANNIILEQILLNNLIQEKLVWHSSWPPDIHAYSISLMIFLGYQLVVIMFSRSSWCHPWVTWNLCSITDGKTERNAEMYKRQNVNITYLFQNYTSVFNKIPDNFGVRKVLDMKFSKSDFDGGGLLLMARRLLNAIICV